MLHLTIGTSELNFDTGGALAPFNKKRFIIGGFVFV